ncbi:MAG: hypothetical protein IIW09_02975, partial [Acetobacter sp.]|nr:hypothetical protein [Acetobacter sp.]
WKLFFTLNQGVIHNAASMGRNAQTRGDIPPRLEYLSQSMGSALLNRIKPRVMTRGSEEKKEQNKPPP